MSDLVETQIVVFSCTGSYKKIIEIPYLEINVKKTSKIQLYCKLENSFQKLNFAYIYEFIAWLMKAFDMLYRLHEDLLANLKTNQ